MSQLVLSLRWVDMATFLLPDASGTVSQWTPDNSVEAKTRKRTVTKLGPQHLENLAASSKRHRRATVLSSMEETPVKIGGSGKVKKTRVGIAAVGHGEPPGVRDARRKGSVTGSDGGPSVRMPRYKFADACRLQGLPEDFLADAPFTADGKLKAVANGVPVMMGRAIARAIKEALKDA